MSIPHYHRNHLNRQFSFNSFHWKALEKLAIFPTTQENVGASWDAQACSHWLGKILFFKFWGVKPFSWEIKVVPLWLKKGTRKGWGILAPQLGLWIRLQERRATKVSKTHSEAILEFSLEREYQELKESQLGMHTGNSGNESMLNCKLSSRIFRMPTA